LQDGSKSVIYRSIAGFDTEVGSMRVLTTEGAEVVKELKDGNEPYVLNVRTDKSPEQRCIRFKHNYEGN